MSKVFKIVVDTQLQAEALLNKFDKIDVSASYRKSPNGKYIVTFLIETK